MDSLDSTIEGELEGVTDKILAEDEARRTEELVRPCLFLTPPASASQATTES